MSIRTLSAFAVSAMLLSACIPENADLIIAPPSGHYGIGPGDQMRVIVFNQPALSNVFGVDAAGNISLPLAGTIRAEGKTTKQLESAIAIRLKESDLVTDPKVAVEMAVYRPFSILGEVRAPGRFAFAPGMSVEGAIAMAGGYTIHADQSRIRVTRRGPDGVYTAYVSPQSAFQPGDTLVVLERWL